MYTYRARVLSVVDGDTIHARVDLGFDVRNDMTLRFAHINAPERGTDEGTIATAFVKEWLTEHADFELRTIKDRREKYGRYLAVLAPAEGGETLNDAMLRLGYAVAYEGGTR